MFRCEIIADSENPQGDRLTSFLVTYPRIVHAEMLRHRMFSRNVASSRAIPFKKMVKDVEENPFIPIAWQKDHKGMQGSEYIDSDKLYNWGEIHSIIKNKFLVNFEEDKSQMSKLFDTYVIPLYNTSSPMTIVDWWLKIKDLMIGCAIVLYGFGATKQLCNRLLEPFMWTTELVSGTEWENFFELRCPKYYYKPEGIYFKSKKDWLKYFEYCFGELPPEPIPIIEWLQINQSQAEIHIQKIAEMMWDAYNESEPKKLERGQWHIPFSDNLDYDSKEVDVKYYELRICTARAARLSYTTLGDNPKIDYKADIKLHDRLLKSEHWSPFEHCARAMTKEEYETYYRGELSKGLEYFHPSDEKMGWCRNFRGFIQYRHLIEEK